jgi:hypothetical protein
MCVLSIIAIRKYDLYVFCGTGLTSACLSVISQFLPGISQILAEKVRKQEKIATRTKEWME